MEQVTIRYTLTGDVATMERRFADVLIKVGAATLASDKRKGRQSKKAR